MKKNIIAFTAILLFITSSYGQTKQQKIEAYNKVNKWAVVKLTIAYIEDLKYWPASTEKYDENKDQNEVATYKKLKKGFDSYNDNVDLEEVSEDLKTGWGGTRKIVFNEYKSELVEKVTVYNFKNVSFVPKKIKRIKNRKEALVEINKRYDSFLKEIVDKQKDKEATDLANSNVSNPTVVEGTGVLEDEANGGNDVELGENLGEEESNLSSIIFYPLLAISVLLNVVLFFALRFKKKKTHNTQNDPGKKYRDLEKLNLSLQNSIKELNSKIKDLEKEDSIKSNLIPSGRDKHVDDTKEKPIEDEKPKVVEFSNVTPIKESSNNMIYFPSPFEERRFSVEDVSEIKKTNSLYVAAVDANHNKGAISLIETADLSRALNSPNTYLETVCDYDNAYSPEAKGIKVVKGGEVSLEGEDWVVTSKIRIKFI